MNKSAFTFYRYKGNEYRVTGTVMMKCPKTRKWLLAMKYEQYNNSSQVYVREVNDFYDKFEGFDP